MSRQFSGVAARIMKAIRISQFGGPEVLKFETDVAIPSINGSEVLVKVAASGVNPVDTYIRTGTYVRKPELPYIPGLDGAGTVHQIGSNVTKFKEGDRVYLFKSKSGSYAEYSVADECDIGILPEGISFEQGAGIGVPYYTAVRAMINRGHAKKGQTLLVHGASGGVGLACVQIGKHLGLEVFATVGSQTGMDVVRSNGADHVFNHRNDGYLDEIKAKVGESGVNLTIEMLSNVNLQSDIDLMSFQGTVVIVGARGPIEISPRSIMAKEGIVTGVSVMRSNQEEFKELNKYIEDGLMAGWLRPHVGPVYALESASQAHVDIIQTAAASGKMVLKV